MLRPGGLSTVYQPILELGPDGPRLFAFECLIRGPRSSRLEPARQLVDFVRRQQRESLLDRACIESALGAAGGLPVRAPLSLNVHAATLVQDPAFPAFLADTAAACSIPPGELIVELIDHGSAWADGAFRAALGELRAAGMWIALDDVLPGQPYQRQMLDFRPEIFKVDCYYARGCRGDSGRESLLAAVSYLASKAGAQVVAKSVETAADLAAMTSCGITLGQGFFFAPVLPAAEWCELGWHRAA